MSLTSVPVYYAASLGSFAPSAFGGGGGGGGTGGAGAPLEAIAVSGLPAPATLWLPVDWKENPREQVLMADLPGMRMEEIEVEVQDDRILRIHGEKRRAAEAADEQFLLVERPVGRFTRTFHMANNADLRRVRAEMENGVLTVVVPKVQNNGNEVNVRSIPISIVRAGN